MARTAKQSAKQIILEALEKAGVDPVIVAAFDESEILIFALDESPITRRELVQWNDLISRMGDVGPPST